MKLKVYLYRVRCITRARRCRDPHFPYSMSGYVRSLRIRNRCSISVIIKQQQLLSIIPPLTTHLLTIRIQCRLHDILLQNLPVFIEVPSEHFELILPPL